MYRTLEVQLSMAKTPEQQADIKRKLLDIEQRAFSKLGAAGVGGGTGSGIDLSQWGTPTKN